MSFICRWNLGWRGRRAKLLGRESFLTQERNWSGNSIHFFSQERSSIDPPFSHHIAKIEAESRELEEQVEKLRERLSEANSDVENWRAGNVEQEDLTECQYQVSRR